MAIPLKYNVRSLLVRRISTAMTGGGIALVVAVFVIVMALVAGLNSAISDTGDPDNLIVLRKGATTETYSAVQIDQFDAMKFLPQIRREPGGEADASPELPVQALMGRVGGGRDNIVVRGVLPIALKVHPKVKIVEGRMFNPSVNEVIVGKGLQTQRADLEEAAMSLGSTPVHAFFAITLPLLMPSMIAAALFAFAVSLDQFVVSYFLSTPGVSTLPVEIYSSIRKGFTPEINAISTIFLGVSTVLVLVFVQLSNLGGKLDRH